MATKKQIYDLQVAINTMGKQMEEISLLFEHYKRRIHAIDKKLIQYHERLANLEGGGSIL